MRSMKEDPVSTETRRNIGDRIRSLREERGLSQYVFSDMVRIDRSYLIGVEKGRRNVSIDNLGKIARGLDVSLSEMMRDVDSFVYEHIHLSDD